MELLDPAFTRRQRELCHLWRFTQHEVGIPRSSRLL